MSLPINAVLPEILTTLAASTAAVLVAPPGAGKTTGVPLALLDAPWLAGRRILVLEPRRLAARAAAMRMAFLLGERVGETVGYRIRLEHRVGPRTRVEVVTEGILTRRLQDDPGLEGVGAVLFDEFHERSLAADTGLALTLASRALLRDDLRILVMSATLDGDAVATLLDHAPVIRSEGRAYPVQTQHRTPAPHARIEGHVAQVVREALATEAGSVLVFLPGAGEIRRVEGMLADGLPPDVSLHPLHGSLPPAQQDAAIAPAAAGKRKVVLATSIAETSLTIEGIRVVVDSGLMRIPRFSPRTGMTRLETMRVSRAAADQRRGRAGRLESGSCWRCWSGAEDAGLVPYTRAEILDADLAPLALELAAAGFADPADLQWLDPPPAAAFAQGRELLTLLGALDAEGRLTSHGRAMATLGTHPRLAHLLLRAREHGAASGRRAAQLAALLEERDILRGAGGPPASDVTLRLDLLERQGGAAAVGAATVDRQGLSKVRELAAEWCRRLDLPPHGSGHDADDAGLLLALAYPDRVAQRRETGGRFLLRNGRGATLPAGDPLAQSAWLVAAQVDDAGREGRILLAAALDPGELIASAGEQVTTTDEIRWDDGTQAVQSRRRTTLGALVFADKALASPDPELVRAALLDGIRRSGIDALPWRADATAVRQRLAFAHALDTGWPDVSELVLLGSLDEWLAPHLAGIRKLDDLARVDLGAALLDLLGWEQRRVLDAIAPVRIEVPSGSQIAVDYSDPSAPVLAVRLQEMFGLSTTPTVGNGRVPLMLHLLSPAGRPMQVTRDLASFWASGYFDVRKDLRGRYPKHHWPENPLEAPAVRGIKRRR
ncbi:MAG: ATP-dependent helicase HrpB [Gemmatimonadota bacterium]